jgi:acyl dehydratase
VSELTTGQALAPLTYSVTRADLVAYAGASGDLNPIHWSDRVSTSVGLPGVVAHGMYTMALAGRALTHWAGSADAVVEFGCRFTRPVVVPDDDEGVRVEVAGAVQPHDDSGLVRIDLTVSAAGQMVLGQARAVVRRR